MKGIKSTKFKATPVGGRLRVGDVFTGSDERVFVGWHNGERRCLSDMSLSDLAKAEGEVAWLHDRLAQLRKHINVMAQAKGGVAKVEEDVIVKAAEIRAEAVEEALAEAPASKPKRAYKKKATVEAPAAE